MKYLAMGGKLITMNDKYVAISSDVEEALPDPEPEEEIEQDPEEEGSET